MQINLNLPRKLINRLAKLIDNKFHGILEIHFADGDATFWKFTQSEKP
jgi:hypothetical protein